MVIAEFMIKLFLFHLTAFWWADLDGVIQDNAHKVKEKVSKLFKSNAANKLILSLGIGNDKKSRVWLRGLFIAALSLNHLNSNLYPIIVFAGLSMMWAPLFNTFLASARSINDDTPELGDYGYEKWLSERPKLYSILKCVFYIIGIALFTYAHYNV